MALSRFSAPPGVAPKATATQTSGRQCAEPLISLLSLLRPAPAARGGLAGGDVVVEVEDVAGVAAVLQRGEPGHLASAVGAPHFVLALVRTKAPIASSPNSRR